MMTMNASIIHHQGGTPRNPACPPCCRASTYVPADRTLTGANLASPTDRATDRVDGVVVNAEAVAASIADARKNFMVG